MGAYGPSAGYLRHGVLFWPNHWSEDCVGKYEFMPDGSWKASGTCTASFKGDKEGDQLSFTWEEGSHLKESLQKVTGGEGKYAGAKAEART